MTTAITQEVTERTRDGRVRSLKGSGDGTSLRVGVAVVWLSVIVLLPLAAIGWQSVGGGRRAF